MSKTQTAESNTQTAPCPECGKENPIGSKFCSGCAVSLVAGPTRGAGSGPEVPNTPPPPPPSRPGLGGMLGQTGGKVDQRQINGDPAALYAAAEAFINGRKDSVIKAQYPPQQITASIVFKDFWATLNSPVKTDCEINIAPAGPGVSTVTVGGKVDFGSASSLWLTSAIIFVLGFLFINWILYTFLFVVGGALQIYLLNSRGPRQVAEDLFEHLSQHGASTPPVAQSPVAAVPHPAGNGSAAEKQGSPDLKAVSSAEDDLAARIRKLDALKDQGLITDDEYQNRRTEILNDI